MSLTQDPTVIEDVFKNFFDDIFANESLKKGFENLDKVIEVVYTKPDMSFIIECRQDKTRFLAGADGSHNPDITILMDWETAHQFWMGNLDTINALFTQKIKIKGDAGALLDLKPLFRETSAIYRKVVSEHDLDSESKC